MRRLAVLAVTAVLVVGALPAVGPAAADGFVGVSTTVTPTQPTVEEAFTVEAVVSNDASSDTTYRITDLTVTETRDADSEALASADVSRRVEPDETVRRGIDVTINETGEQTVYLQVSLLDDSGEKQIVTQPVTVTVRDPHPQISVSGASAAPGEARPLTVTLSNGLDSRLSNVELRVASQNLSVDDDRRVLAGVNAGAERTFEFSVTPTANSQQPVNVFIEYTIDGERRSVERELQAAFSAATGTDDEPQVQLDVQEAIPGAERSVDVTVTNGLTQDLRQLRVTVSTDNETLSFTETEEVQAALAAGETGVFQFPATVDAAGEYPVSVTLSYTENGVRKRVTRTFSGDFTGPDTTEGTSDQPQVQVDVQEAIPGAERSVEVTVANGLTKELRQLRVIVSSNNETVSFRASERVQAALAAGETTTFGFPAAVDAAGQYPVTVTLVYTDDGIRKRVSQTFSGDFTGPASPGTVELTNVQAVVSNGQLRIDATAGNPGTTNVGGVTVAIGDSDAVGSADFFLGQIEASDGFQSFTLTAPASGDVSSVPVRVSYVIDGVRLSQTIQLDVVQRSTPVPQANETGPQLGLVLPGAGVVVVLLVVVGLVRRWR